MAEVSRPPPLQGVIHRMAIIDEEQLELKKIAAQLTASMLDNHNGDWDDTATAKAFKTIYEAVRQA